MMDSGFEVVNADPLSVESNIERLTSSPIRAAEPTLPSSQLNSIVQSNLQAFYNSKPSSVGNSATISSVSDMVESPSAPNIIIEGKRTITDTSFDNHGNQLLKQPRHGEHPDYSLSSSSDISTVNSDSVLKAFENMINGLKTTLTERLDSIDDKLSGFIGRIDFLETRVDELAERQASTDLATDNMGDRLQVLEEENRAISERLTAMDSRPSPALATLEEENRVLSERLTAMEARPTPAPTPATWEPQGPTATRVLLLGDSNSAGKVKFGDGRGTLGSLFPGSDTFCAKICDLPGPASNNMGGCTDYVISVGTNDLKLDNSCPTTLARELNKYVVTLTHSRPSAHIFLCGVLPVNAVDSPILSKISQFNYYLADMCKALQKVSYIDMKCFQSRGGSLQPRYAIEGDLLHLGEVGIRMFGSRIKYALRERYSLPNMSRSWQARRNLNPEQVTGGPVEERGYRGRGGNRGGSRGRGDNRNSRGNSDMGRGGAH